MPPLAHPRRLRAPPSHLVRLLPVLAMVALLAGCGEQQPDLTSAKSKPAALRITLTGANTLGATGQAAYVARSPDCRTRSFSSSKLVHPFFSESLAFKTVTSREVIGRFVFPGPSRCEWAVSGFIPLRMTINGSAVALDREPFNEYQTGPAAGLKDPLQYGCSRYLTSWDEQVYRCKLDEHKTSPVTLTLELSDAL